jgi:hypothetical protein
MTHYIVSGYARSGTSMMTRCLDLGGIPAYYDKAHVVKAGTNKYGSYEVSLKEGKSDEAAATKWASMFQHPDMVVKVLLEKIKHIPTTGEYRIVFMLRDPEAIYKSYMQAWGDAYYRVMIDANRIKKPVDYHKLIAKTQDMLAEKENVEVIPVQYESIVADPLPYFLLLEQKGWPINPHSAAAGVEPEEKHF